MMKIKKIEVQNYKAISNQIVDFDGCSAIVTAGNDKGKTSLLKGLIDRMRGLKPEIILKEGEEKGRNSIELTDGSCIEWKFTEKTENFAFITKDGFKQTTGVLKSFGERYFGIYFDIDKFLLASSKQQSEMLAKLIGLDFSEIDQRYKVKYDERTETNREVARLRAMNLSKPEEVKKPDIERAKKRHEEIKNENRKIQENWFNNNEKRRKAIEEFNHAQNEKRQVLLNAEIIFNNLLEYKEGLFDECIDFDKAEKVIKSLLKPEELKEYKQSHEPSYMDEQITADAIEKAYHNLRLYDKYEDRLKEYNNWIAEGRHAIDKANEIEKQLNAIKIEKAEMLKKANIPDDFSFTDDGLLFRGFPLSTNQISTSAKYIAALKLGSLSLGEIETLHFEASALDRVSLNSIQKWASENGLQLLIEKPDFEGGEIKYEIIRNNEK